MVFEQNRRVRPTVEDWLRAAGYLCGLVWALAFAIVPPVAYIDSLDLITRLAWVGACGFGASVAMLGAVFRYDLKGELPGIAFMIIGPIFYCIAQVWLTVSPPEGATTGSRFALIFYAIWPAILVLPRMYSLWVEAHRSRAIRREVGRIGKELGGPQ